jgi:hypothetical protein
LNRLFQGDGGSNEQVEMIGHQNEFVQEVGFTSMGEEGLQEQASPWFGPK